MRSLQLLALALGSSLVACAPAGVNGTVSGNALNAKDAIFGVLDDQSLVILIGEHDSLCSAIAGNAHFANASALALRILRHDSAGNPLPIVPGKYSVTTNEVVEEMPAQAAAARFLRTGPDCAGVLSDDQSVAISGTVTIDSVESGKDARGSFDIKVGTQADELTGSFDAGYCEALTTYDVSGQSVCK